VRTPDLSDSDYAYAWTSATPGPLAPLPQLPADNPGTIGGGIDDVVMYVLKHTGMLDELDKVTGQPQTLMAAAHSWQDQARALRAVTDELRSGAGPVAQNWHGDASNGFGTLMGQLVEAIDGTAEDADTTAGILAGAANQCQFAENAVIGIIREAIEWIAMTVAAGMLADFLTLGLASIADALIADEEVAIFLQRVEKVSADLAKSLKELEESLKAMKEAKGAKATWDASKDVRKIIKALRTGGKTWWNPLTYPDAYKGTNLAGQLLIKPVTAGLAKPIIGGLTGMDGKPLDPIKQLIEGDPQKTDPAPAPYHVNKSRIEQAFG
jgi:uncharacterized protein YukE